MQMCIMCGKLFCMFLCYFNDFLVCFFLFIFIFWSFVIFVFVVCLVLGFVCLFFNYGEEECKIGEVWFRGMEPN